MKRLFLFSLLARVRDKSMGRGVEDRDAEKFLGWAPGDNHNSHHLCDFQNFSSPLMTVFKRSHALWQNQVFT